MNEFQAENLRKLIRHMETSVARVLNMNKMFADPQGTTGDCGTPACALGEATFCPALAHLGLPRKWGFLRVNVHGAMFTNDGDRLFGLDIQNAWKRSEVTPREWATEARKVLAETGYGMEPIGAVLPVDASADFGRFMGRVRKPVLTSTEEAGAKLDGEATYR